MKQNKKQKSPEAITEICNTVLALIKKEETKKIIAAKEEYAYKRSLRAEKEPSKSHIKWRLGLDKQTREKYLEAKADAETWNKPFFATDCARKALVFKKMYASDEDIPLSVVGCGRWDCLPCSAHKARLFVMYLTDVTKDWEHMMMWTFTVRHDDTMDRNVHKKVLFSAFAKLFKTIADSHNYHQQRKNFLYKDNSSILNGSRPNIRYIRVNERHRNGFLHIHALVDTYLPHDAVYEKFNNLVESYAKKFNLLEGCSEEFIEKWNHQYLWLASSASNGHWFRKAKKDLAVFRKLNGGVHVLMAKATKDPSASLHKYISKMSSEDIGMKIANIKEYRRRIVAIQLGSYLSKKNDRREKAVELTLQYPYPNMKYFSTRIKLVKSMEKWMKEKATGEWKLIGFGKPGGEYTGDGELCAYWRRLHNWGNTARTG